MNKENQLNRIARKDVALQRLYGCLSMILTIFLLIAYTGLSAQTKEYRDLVILKDDTVLEPVQTLVIRTSLILFTEEGTTTIYFKKDVSGLGKGKREGAFKLTPSKGKWSTYQGEMNWTDAKKKCASVGMRLPTIHEFLAASADRRTDLYLYLCRLTKGSACPT